MLNIAIVGIGNWGKKVIRNFYELQEVDTLFCYDLNPSSLKWIRENYPEVITVTSYEDILDSKKISAVVITTPPWTHFFLAKKALEAGKHVFVEKPLTLKAKDAEFLVTLAERQGKILMVGHILRYHPAIQVMKEIIKKGELGRIYYTYSQRLNLGRVRGVENAMWCLAPHDISIILYLLEKDPRQVSAYGGCFLQREKSIEDVVFLSLTFDKGVFSHIHVSWLDPTRTRKTVVVGENKVIVLDELSPQKKLKLYTIERKKGIDITLGEAISPPVPDGEPLREECLHFITCILTNTPPLTDGQEGLRVVKILEMAQKSLEKGSPMKVN